MKNKKMRKIAILFTSRKSITAIIIFLLLVLFSFLIIKDYLHFKRGSRIYTSTLFDSIDLRMDSLVIELRDFSRNGSRKISSLSKSAGVYRLINASPLRANSGAVKQIEEEFLEFLDKNSEYYEIILIDQRGQEVVRVGLNNDGVVVVSEDKLRDESDNYYFTQTAQLKKGEVFMSNLKIDISDPNERVAVIHFSTPLFDEDETRKGVLMVSVNADYFLDDIRRFQRPRELVFLLDKNGDYLAHPDKTKEFASEQGKVGSFYIDYPGISREIVEDVDRRRVESGGQFFSFQHIYPLIGSYELYKGSEKILGHHPEKHYYWTLVNVTDKMEINKGLNGFRQDFVFSVLFSGAIVLICGALVFTVAFKIPRNR